VVPTPLQWCQKWDFYLWMTLCTDELYMGRCKLKSSIFWDIMPCSLMKVIQLFRGTCHSHLQNQRISQAKNQHVASIKHSSSLSRLNSIITHEIELFITTAITTKNPTGVNWFTKIKRIKGNCNGGSHVIVLHHSSLD
jgi:hypothetical protein